jgi:hypothetical protein
MSRSQYHNIVTATEYARLHGISARTARRRLAGNPHAVRTGRGYSVAIPSTEYAKLAGISPSSARKQGVKNEHPTDLIAGTIPETNPTKLYERLSSFVAHGKGQPSPHGIKRNIRRMSRAQRRKASKIDSYEDYIDMMGSDDFYDEEGEHNLLWYH